MAQLWDSQGNASANAKEIFRAAVNKFGSYKAPGVDGIKPLILKNLDETLIEAILSIYNAIIEIGYTPTTWKQARVIMISKGRGDLANPRSYRPISLTSFLLKTLERIHYGKWRLLVLRIMTSSMVSQQESPQRLQFPKP